MLPLTLTLIGPDLKDVAKYTKLLTSWTPNDSTTFKHKRAALMLEHKMNREEFSGKLDKLEDLKEETIPAYLSL